MSADQQTREIKARYLKTGMIALIDGEHLTVGTVNRYAADTVLAYFEGVPTPTSYNVEEGVTVVGDATEQPTPDYWLTLAADLRQAADRIATLAGTPAAPVPASINLHILGSVLNRDAEHTMPMVDALAAAFGVTACRNDDGNRYEASGRIGSLTVHPYTFVPKPDDPEKAAMRAELDALRAQLAEGGETR